MPTSRTVSVALASWTTTVSPSTARTTVPAPGGRSAPGRAGAGQARNVSVSAATAEAAAARARGAGDIRLSEDGAVTGGARPRGAPGGARCSDALDDRAGAQAATAAHADEGGGLVGPLELVEGLGHEERPRTPEGVAEGDGPAVGVGLVEVGLDLAGPGQHDRGEGLVDLEQVDVADGHARAVEQPAGGVDGPRQHEHRVDAHQAGVDHPGPGREP